MQYGDRQHCQGFSPPRSADGCGGKLGAAGSRWESLGVQDFGRTKDFGVRIGCKIHMHPIEAVLVDC